MDDLPDDKPHSTDQVHQGTRSFNRLPRLVLVLLLVLAVVLLMQAGLHSGTGVPWLKKSEDQSGVPVTSVVSQTSAASQTAKITDQTGPVSQPAADTGQTTPAFSETSLELLARDFLQAAYFKTGLDLTDGEPAAVFTQGQPFGLLMVEFKGFHTYEVSWYQCSRDESGQELPATLLWTSTPQETEPGQSWFNSLESGGDLAPGTYYAELVVDTETVGRYEFQIH